MIALCSMTGLVFLSFPLLVAIPPHVSMPFAAFAVNTVSAPSQALPPAEMEIYRCARTVIDMTNEELLQTYSDEVRGLEFAEDQQELNSLLQRVGGNVEKFFQDICLLTR